MVVTGVLFGAAVVQPEPANVAGTAPELGATCPAQLGGTDNRPTEDACPTTADTGAAPTLAGPAGSTAPVRAAAPKPPGAPAPAADASAPVSAPGARKPELPSWSRSDAPEPKLPTCRATATAPLLSALGTSPYEPFPVKKPSRLDPDEPVAAELAASVALYELALAPRV